LTFDLQRPCQLRVSAVRERLPEAAALYVER
jgi:hypothetical protein